MVSLRRPEWALSFIRIYQLLLLLLLVPSLHSTNQGTTEGMITRTLTYTKTSRGDNYMKGTGSMSSRSRFLNSSTTKSRENNSSSTQSTGVFNRILLSISNRTVFYRSNSRSTELAKKTLFMQSNRTVLSQSSREMTLSSSRTLLPVSNRHHIGLLSTAIYSQSKTTISPELQTQNRTILEESNINKTVLENQFSGNITGNKTYINAPNSSGEYLFYDVSSGNGQYTGVFASEDGAIVTSQSWTSEQYTEESPAYSRNNGGTPASTKNRLSDLFLASTRRLDSLASQGLSAVTDRTELDGSSPRKTGILDSTEAPFLDTDKKHNGSLIVKTLADIKASNSDTTTEVSDKNLNLDITTDIPYWSMSTPESLTKSEAIQDQYDHTLKETRDLTTNILYPDLDSLAGSESSREQYDPQSSSQKHLPLDPYPSHLPPSLRPTTAPPGGGRASRRLVAGGVLEEEGVRVAGHVTVGLVEETSVSGDVEVEQLTVDEGLTIGHVVLLGVAILGAALLAFTNMVGVCCCKSYFKTRRQGSDLLYRAVTFSRDVTRDASGSDVTENASRDRRSRGFSLRTRDSIIRRLAEEREEVHVEEGNSTSGPTSTTMTSRPHGLTQRFYNVQEQQRRRGKRVQLRRTLFEYGHEQEDPSCV